MNVNARVREILRSEEKPWGALRDDGARRERPEDEGDDDDGEEMMNDNSWFRFGCWSGGFGFGFGLAWFCLLDLQSVPSRPSPFTGGLAH